MPIHDWSKAPSGLFHHFHQRWAGAICDNLNDGRLPKGFYALVEQHATGVIPDVLTLERKPGGEPEGGVAVADAPPKTRFIARADEKDMYAMRANYVAVRHSGGQIVAVIQIVSPGNKDRRHSLRSFVEKNLEFLRRGVNLLLIDLFPPSPRDPQGIHGLLWNEIRDEPFELPKDKPLTLVSYAVLPTITAYIEPVALGDALPDTPVFLDEGLYAPAALDVTYEEIWNKCPAEFKEDVLGAQKSA